jgi:hypothetical protein
MHDLPAVRGEEVTNDVLDGAPSIVRRQAFHKRTAAGASLLWCLGEAGRVGADPEEAHSAQSSRTAGKEWPW